MTKVISRCLSLLVTDDLNALKKTTVSDIANTPVFLLKLLGTSAQLLTALGGLLGDVVSLDDLEHFAAVSSGQRVVEVSR